MIVNIKEMLKEANSTNRIIPSFNVWGYEDAKLVMQVASEMHAPAIILSNKSAVENIDIEVLSTMYRIMANKYDAKIALQFDHGESFDTCKKAIDLGFSSVMYDGSELTLHQNISNSIEIVDFAHSKNITVEGEIGAVGYMDIYKDHKTTATDVEEAIEYITKTNIDALAISVGTLHRYTGRDVKINYEIIKQIEKKTNKPLVIHGASGISDEDLIKLRNHNIAKINIGTAVRKALGVNIRKYLDDNLEAFDKLNMMNYAMPYAYEVIKDKYKILGW